MNTLYTLGKGAKSRERLHTIADVEKLKSKMRTFLQEIRLPIRPERGPFRNLWQEQSNKLILQDLEFVQEKAFGAHINHGALSKAYGPPSDEETDGMTIHDVASHLETLVAGQEFLLVEWSTNYCDYDLLFKTLDEIGKSHILPPRKEALSLLNA